MSFRVRRGPYRPTGRLYGEARLRRTSHTGSHVVCGRRLHEGGGGGGDFGGVSDAVRARCTGGAYTGGCCVGRFGQFRGYVLSASVLLPNTVPDSAQGSRAV